METRQRGQAAMSSGDVSEVSETSPLKGSGDESVSKSRATACSRAQAKLQSWLRPAMWIPGLNRLHSHREVWMTEDSTPQKNIESIQRALVKVIENDKTRSDFYINSAESDFIQIFVFTRAEWLDVIEMHFEDNQIKMFFWVPFLDMGMNQKRLRWLQSQMDIPVERRTPAACSTDTSSAHSSSAAAAASSS